jgi:hypothetical protein
LSTREGRLRGTSTGNAGLKRGFKGCQATL